MIELNMVITKRADEQKEIETCHMIRIFSIFNILIFVTHEKHCITLRISMHYF